MSSCLLSVVVITYKRDQLLRECLASLATQDLPLEEVIVVDDGGSGSARAVVDSFGKPFRYVHQENAGMQAARNTGIAESRGDWVAFLDDDDLWLPMRHAQLRNIIEDCRAPVISTNFVKFSDGVDHTGTIHDEIEQRNPGFFDGLRQGSDSAYSLVSQFPLERLMPVHAFWPSSLVVSRQALSELGGWDVTLRTVKCEDIDFVYRALSRFPLAIAWQPSLRYRSHAGNDASNSIANLLGHIFIWKRVLADAGIAPSLQKRIKSAISQMQHEVLWMAFSEGKHELVLSTYAELDTTEVSVKEHLKALMSRMKTNWRRA